MTPTSVVHVQDVRVGDGHIYIGRGRGDVLGNPIRLNVLCPRCKAVHRSVRATLPCYRQLLALRLEDPIMQRMLERLSGRALACHCAPAACHGDVLAAVANAFETGGVEAAKQVLQGPVLVA